MDEKLESIIKILQPEHFSVWSWLSFLLIALAIAHLFKTIKSFTDRLSKIDGTTIILYVLEVILTVTLCTLTVHFFYHYIITSNSQNDHKGFWLVVILVIIFSFSTITSAIILFLDNRSGRIFRKLDS